MYSLQGFPDEGSDNMKIEKVNENQIRCTLTREDLAERQIKLSELAYGTEKAKMLFRRNLIRVFPGFQILIRKICMKMLCQAVCRMQRQQALMIY